MKEQTTIKVPFNKSILVLTRAEFIRAIRRGKQAKRAESTKKREQAACNQWPEVRPHDT